MIAKAISEAFWVPLVGRTRQTSALAIKDTGLRVRRPVAPSNARHNLKAGWITILFLAHAATACAQVKSTAPTEARVKPSAEIGSAEVVNLRVGVESLGAVPNSGLSLPEVSVNAASIAWLEVEAGHEVESDAVVTGRGLERVSLSVRELKRGGEARVVCSAGAAWPVWFPNGKRLAFVVYDAQGRGSLAVYDMNSQETKRWGIGMNHLLMPAVSPDGKRVAVVGYAQTPGDARIMVLDVEAGKVDPGPFDTGIATQMAPRWLDNGVIVFIGIGPEQNKTRAATLDAWALGGQSIKPLRKVNVPPNPADVSQTLIGIGIAVNAAGDRFAYYDYAADAIQLLHLTGDESRQLPRGVRAGTWLGNERFAGATDREFNLYGARDNRSQSIMAGSWLPRYADKMTGTILALVPAGAGQGFEVVRLRLEAGPVKIQPR